nr:hypothetical protein [uncultured Celeribacter sp.]
MLVKCKSTRHTKIGTLRRGVVYDLDEKNAVVAKVIKVLSGGKKPVMMKLSKEDAQKAATAAVTLSLGNAPNIEGVTPDGADAEMIAENLDLKEKIKSAGEQLASMASDCEEKKAEAENMKGEIAALKEAAGVLEDEVKSLKGSNEAAEQRIQAVEAERDALAAQIPAPEGKKTSS